MPYSLYCRARAVMRQRFGVVPLQESLPDVADWLETPLGQAVLEQERMLLEQELQDLFGYHLLQMSVDPALDRSEEHTSELQSRGHLVCRLLLEKKKNNKLHTSEDS